MCACVSLYVRVGVFSGLSVQLLYGCIILSRILKHREIRREGKQRNTKRKRSKRDTQERPRSPCFPHFCDILMATFQDT